MKFTLIRLSLALSLMAFSPFTSANDEHQDYMEHPDLESEAQLYEANTAPKVSFQELPYYEEEPAREEYEAEYTGYENP